MGSRVLENLGFLPSLNELRFRESFLPAKVPTFGFSTAFATNLKILEFQNVSFSWKTILKLERIISNFTVLENLKFSSNKFYGPTSMLILSCMRVPALEFKIQRTRCAKDLLRLRQIDRRVRDEVTQPAELCCLYRRLVQEEEYRPLEKVIFATLEKIPGVVLKRRWCGYRLEISDMKQRLLYLWES